MLCLMNREPFEPLRIQRASLDDQAAALELVYSQLTPADRQRRMDELAAESPQGLVAGLWVGYRGDSMAGAVLAQVLPGKTALVSPPRISGHEPIETALELLTPIIAQLSHDDVRLAQTLLDTEPSPDARVMTELGFHYASDLLFLVSVEDSFPQSRAEDSLEYLPCLPGLDGRLADIVQRTYVGSLDCPEIDGVRQLDDVLNGYRKTGVFHPERWMLVRHKGVDVGCLLLTDHPRSNQWEMIYMGLVSEARGKGFGKAIARYAQWRARQAERRRLVLAVDANNAPAISAYLAMNFVIWDRRRMFLRVL